MAEVYCEENSDPTLVKFRFGLNTISAIGSWSDNKHPNVLRLTIIRSWFDKAVIYVLLALPNFTQDIARALFPGYFLPSRIVLKKMKPDWDDEFNNEVRAYEQLHPVQGYLVPTCYGLAWCDGKRALVLSEIDGVLPFEQPVETPLETAEFLRRLQAAFDTLGTFGLFYGDLKLDNFLLVDDRIMILDLESAEEGDEADVKYVTRGNVEFLGARYKAYLKNRYMP